MRPSFLLATVLGTLTLAAWTHAARAAPAISCPQPEFNFGEAESGLDVHGEFVIRNDGDAPLTISKVLPGCGCTTARMSTDIIAPGQQGVLSATVSLKLQKGAQRKEIVLASNDPKNPRTVVYLVGTATYPFSITPERLAFGPVDAHAGASRTIDLASGPKGKPIRVTALEVGDPNSVLAALEEVVAGESYRIRVTLKPPLSPGDFQSFVRVRTDNKNVPLVGVAITATVAGELAVAPGQLRVLDPKDKAGVTQYVVVKGASVKEFRILSVVSPDPSVKVDVLPIDAGTYRIRVANLFPTPSLEGKLLLINTDVPGMPVVRIPVRVVNQGHAPASVTATSMPAPAPGR
jgi:hypothetical protein